MAPFTPIPAEQPRMRSSAGSTVHECMLITQSAYSKVSFGTCQLDGLTVAQDFRTDAGIRRQIRPNGAALAWSYRAASEPQAAMLLCCEKRMVPRFGLEEIAGGRLCFETVITAEMARELRDQAPVAATVQS